jgi:hypothetical protein
MYSGDDCADVTLADHVEMKQIITIGQNKAKLG